MNRRTSVSARAVLAQTALLSGMGESEIEQFLIDVGSDPAAVDHGRRDFLKALGIGAASLAGAAVLGDTVAKALWVPGAKTFFLPPEKGPIVSGQDAVTAMRQIVEADPALRGQGVHVVYTGVGECTFDKDWNLLVVHGKRVTAMEAARLQSSNYQHGIQPRHTARELQQLAREIEARRTLAGIRS